MITAFSIVVGILAAFFAYRILFYDFSDFGDGIRKFVSLFTRKHRWLRFGHDPLHPPPEYFEDESWSSGIRFALFLVLSIGSGYSFYHELHKHFG
jgi:hypothetical protein